jgi:hypothetical protein
MDELREECLKIELECMKKQRDLILVTMQKMKILKKNFKII